MLQRPSCMLEKLDLSWNTINDTAARCLCVVLRNNSTVKMLYLNRISSLTIAGWQILIEGYLHSPNCMLDTMGLDGNDFSYGLIQVIANSFTNNGRPRELSIPSNAACVGMMPLEAGEVVTETERQAFLNFLHSPTSSLKELNLKK